MLFTSNPMRSAIPNRLAHNSKAGKLPGLKNYILAITYPGLLNALLTV